MIMMMIVMIIIMIIIMIIMIIVLTLIITSNTSNSDSHSIANIETTSKVGKVQLFRTAKARIAAKTWCRRRGNKSQQAVQQSKLL